MLQKAASRVQAFFKDRVHLKTLLLGSALTLCGAVFVGLLNYLVRRVTANGLSVDDYGYFYSVFSLCSLCVALTEFGTQSAGVILISRYLASGRKSRADAVFNMILLFNVVAGLLVAVPLAAASPWLTGSFFKYGSGGLFCFLFMLLYVLANSVETIFRGGLTAVKDFLAFNLVNAARAFLMCLGVFLLLPFLKIDGAALAFVFSVAASAFLAFKLLRGRVDLKLRLGFSKRAFLKVLKLCGWMTLSGTGLTALFYLDTLCLNWLGSLKDVALYQIALPLMQLTMSLIVMPMVFMPIAAELWEKGKRKQIERYCLAMAACAALALAGLAVLGRYVAPLAIRILFGEKFEAASGPLIWLWGGMIFYAAAQFNIAALNAGGLQRLPALTICATVPVNIALNVALIPRYGTNGAAAATAFSYLLIAVCTGACLWRELRKEEPGVKA